MVRRHDEIPTMRALTWLLAACLLAHPAFAQSPSVLDAIQQRGALRVGLTGDYRPFSLRDPVTGAIEGLDVDVAQEMAAALGVTLEIVPTAWANLLPDLEAGKFDLAAGGVSITLDRQKAAFFSIPLMRSGKTPIARCTDAAKYQTLAAIDMPGIRVITNPGGTNERFDRAQLHAADIVVFPANAAIFDELVAGRADVMLTDAVETRLQQKLHPELCAIHPDQPFNFSELAYLLPQDVPFQQWVNQFLHIATQTGQYGRLTAKWLN